MRVNDSEKRCVIVGMRNRIAHGYDQVDEEVIWVTATDDIPRLIEQLEAMLTEDRQRD